MPKVYLRHLFLAEQQADNSRAYRVLAYVGSTDDPEFSKAVPLLYTVDPSKTLSTILDEIKTLLLSEQAIS